MSTSHSFVTPMSAFSTVELGINNDQDDDNRSRSSHENSSYPMVSLKRNRSSSGVLGQQITTDNQPPSLDADLKNTTNDDVNDHDDDRARSLYYDKNRLKQERLLLFTNIFRLLIIFILAPILYFKA